jgi:hypothetical protein
VVRVDGHSTDGEYAVIESVAEPGWVVPTHTAAAMRKNTSWPEGFEQIVYAVKDAAPHRVASSDHQSKP